MQCGAADGRPHRSAVFTSASALASLVIALGGCASHDQRFPFSGTVQAQSAAVGSTIGGRIVQVAVQDGAAVHRGQTIVRFDDHQQVADLDAAIAQARQADAALADLVAGPRSQDVAKAAADAASADAQYRNAALSQPQQEASAVQAVREAAANLRAARASAVDAQRDYRRQRVLYAQGAISSQSMDASRAAAQVAANNAAAAGARLRTAIAALASVRSGSVSAQVDAAKAAAEAADANLALVRAGSRPDQIAQARAAATAAEANVAAARARLDETIVRAPQDGVVDALDLHAGDLVAAGASVATIDEFLDPWVRIYVGQPDVGRFKIGSSVSVASDSLPGQTFSGHVEMIDDAAQFTPRDVQTESDRAELTFGVKIDIQDPQRSLRSGTTVEVGLP